MPKCRGCGKDDGSLMSDVEGLGWMHVSCENKRQANALREARSYLYPFDDGNEKAPEVDQGLDENERVVIVVNA